jgi:HYR domain
LLAPHEDVLATQDSPAGASVAYELPAVSDNGDAAPVVTCAPASGGTFPIGTTPVTCSAVDASGNTSSPAQFGIVVQQGEIPPTPVIASDVGALTRRTTAQFTFSVPEGLTVECRLDSSAGAGSFGPCETRVSQSYSGLADGDYLFTLRVTNSIGNVNEATHAWTVDTVAPAAVLGLRTEFGNGWIKLLWNLPTEVDYSHVTVWRKRLGATSWKRLGTRSARSTFLDEPVPNDVRFVYSLVSFDEAGNGSLAARVTGRASRILSPPYGAVLHSPPLIDWTRVRNATYFNLQLWRHGRKILSVWPLTSSYRLRATWTFNGRHYAFEPGRYIVYVWPGFGAKSAVDYGPLLGWTSFSVN